MEIFEVILCIYAFIPAIFSRTECSLEVLDRNLVQIDHHDSLDHLNISQIMSFESGLPESSEDCKGDG